MNVNALHKIIRKLVLNKYDWIEDYEIDLVHHFITEQYNIIYYVKPDEDGSFTVTEEMSDVESLTRSLFKLLGPEKHQICDNVVFRVKGKDYRI